MTDQPQIDAPAPDPTYPDSEIQRAQEAINNMNPDALLEMESVLNANSDVNAIPEAGGIAFTEFEGEHGGVIHATARGTHPTRAIQMLLEALQYLKSLQPNVKWRIPDVYKPAPPAPPATPAPQTPAQAQTPAPAAAPAPQPAPQADQVQYVDVHSEQQVGAPAPQAMVITKIDIAPLPEGRVKVEMFAPGHKWPDLRVVNWTVQSVLENLVDPNMGWDAGTLAAAQSITGNFAVQWEYSTTSMNTKGEPYKDVKKIAVAA